jgi:hypothetical protein
MKSRPSSRPTGEATIPGNHSHANRRSALSRARLLARIRGEFAEMPCLSLTMAQSIRLFALRADVCQRVLDTLVAQRILAKRTDGRYVLSAHGMPPRNPLIA